MNSSKFAKIAESLRAYRRAELREFTEELGESPLDKLYVDPLPNDGVLNSVLSGNTTFLLGRKGTGKSTVFAKAQSIIRKKREDISIYIDVKSLHEIAVPENPIANSNETGAVDAGLLSIHLLRKHFLGAVVGDLLSELVKTIASLSFIERWFSKKRSYDDLKQSLEQLQGRVEHGSLTSQEIPILQKITRKWKNQSQQERSATDEAKSGFSISQTGAKGTLQATSTDFDKTLEDKELYTEYSDVVLQSFPFQAILKEIQDLLAEVGVERLIVFFDDFSELRLIDQKLFVDVVLGPLNNASNEKIKLKIAGYPGRVYYGKIDPSKVDTISLDFSTLFEAPEVQTMEASAIEYAGRLVRTRFEMFGEKVEDYFDPSVSFSDHLQGLFQATFNVPRLMGALLHTCYLDRVSKGQYITLQAIRLAAHKYYDSTVLQYFDRLNRFALEPFENKLDRHNQYGLLQALISEAKSVRKGIQNGTIGVNYFQNVKNNPPTSHFIVSPNLEDVLQSLESNFLVTRYDNTRNKSGQPTIAYAFHLGLTEAEKMRWGYPEGREFRGYFVQRCFDYTSIIHRFLSERQTIRCNSCGRSYPLDQQPSLELYKWRCPECGEGICSVVNIKDDFEREVAELQQDLMLEDVEIEILTTLHEERSHMKSGEISSLIDSTYQMVGKRTAKLQEMGLVHKERAAEDGIMRNSLTDRAKNIYFDEPLHEEHEVETVDDIQS